MKKASFFKKVFILAPAIGFLPLAAGAGHSDSSAEEREACSYHEEEGECLSRCVMDSDGKEVCFSLPAFDGSEGFAVCGEEGHCPVQIEGPEVIINIEIGEVNILPPSGFGYPAKHYKDPFFKKPEYDRRRYRRGEPSRHKEAEGVGLSEITSGLPDKAALLENCGNYDCKSSINFSIFGSYPPAKASQSCMCKLIDEGLKPLCEREKELKSLARRHEDDKKALEGIDIMQEELDIMKEDIGETLYVMADTSSELLADIENELDKMDKDTDIAVDKFIINGGLRLIAKDQIGGAARFAEGKARNLCAVNFSSDADDGEEFSWNTDSSQRSLCGFDQKCSAFCDQAFSRNRNERHCKNLTQSEAGEVKEAYVFFKDFDEYRLEEEGIPFDGLEELFKISISPIHEIFHKTALTDRKEIFAYLLETPQAAGLFYKADQKNDFRLLKHLRLFESWTSLSSRTFEGETAMQIIIDEANWEAFSWIHGFAINRLCGGKIDSECFKGYCRMAGKLSSMESENLLYFDEFEGFLNYHIIGKKINQENWLDKNIKDADDLNNWDNWQQELCGQADSAKAG